MDIIIKSFNRPYYLDRCIQSIKMHCTGATYTIKILDDGTPQKYLDKIMLQHPEVLISRSALASQKAQQIATTGSTVIKEIPVELWVSAAKDASDYFLMLEDDFWFTAATNLAELETAMRKEKMICLKLFWLGNPMLIHGRILQKTDSYTQYKPALFTRNPILYRLVFRVNQYKIRKVLSLFKLYTLEKALRYYSIYTVAGALFEKDYFSALWQHHSTTVDESHQLQNAVSYLYKHQGDVHFGHTNEEVLQTGFTSSATNNAKSTAAHLEMFHFNKCLNEAWLAGNLQAMEGYPNDFPSESITALLFENAVPETKPEHWQLWVQEFKEQYRAIGCNIN